MRNKIAAGIVSCVGLLGGGGYLLFGSEDGVADRYANEVQMAQTGRDKAEQIRLDARMLGNIFVEVDRIEAKMLELNQTHVVADNANEGVYTVEQERDIAEAYGRYLSLRKALFHIAFRNMSYGELEGRQSHESFLLAYGAGLALYRNAVLFVMVFKDQPNARRKLNEGMPTIGIPPGMFEEMYGNITARDNVQLVLEGIEEFEERRAEIEGLELLGSPEMSGLLARLDRYERELGEAYAKLGEGRKDVLWTRAKSRVSSRAYRAQSMISMMVSHIRSPLHSPGLSPKSINGDIRPELEPGDILLTTREGYLSNAFLPGNWGHAALYLGSADELRALGDNPKLDAALAEVGYEGVDNDGAPYAAIEAIGEGVRLSSLEFALDANVLAVLRPKLSKQQKQDAAVAALALEGTPYDFAFDVFSQDKIICTELVYRAYSPHLDGGFELVMGRKTLKPDGMLAAISPAAEDPLTELVVFGRSVEGALERASLDALMATLPEGD